MRETISKTLSAALLGVSGLFFTYLAIESFYSFLKSLQPHPDLGHLGWELPIIILGVVCLFVPIAGLLLSATVFEFKQPKPKFVWTAFGLIVGFTLGSFFVDLIMVYNSTLWHIMPDHMIERILRSLCTSLFLLAVFTIWFALPLWRNRPGRIVSAS